MDHKKFHLRTLLPVLLAIFLFLSLVRIAVPVSADAAPPPPPSAANPQAGSEQTQVRMMDETVTMEIAKQSSYKHGQARVNATFHMRNLGSKEEKLEVRFPLNTVLPGQRQNEFRCVYLGSPSIQDLTAQVNQHPVAVRSDPEPAENYATPGPEIGLPNIHIPCWAHFEVTFPPGKEVTLDVSYTAQGGELKNSPDDPYQSFYYILETGQGWKDTIGAADITVRVPFSLNEQNLIYAGPKGYSVIDENTLHWHFENLEPDARHDIGLSILEPGLWQRILAARKLVADQPNSASGWAQLALADHAAVVHYSVPDETYPVSGLLRAAPQSLISETREAYQKALAFSPQDNDLRLSYAKLLLQSLWQVVDDRQAYQQGVTASLEQILTVLKDHPDHPLANKMLRYIGGIPWGNGTMIDLNSAPPNFFILTPLPAGTLTSTAINPPLPTATEQPTPTTTFAPSPTDTAQPTLTQVSPPVENSTAASQSTQIASSQTTKPIPAEWLWVGSGAALVLLIYLLAKWRRGR